MLRCYARIPELGDVESLLGFWQRFGVAYVLLLTVPPERYDAFLPEAQAIFAAFDPGPE